MMPRTMTPDFEIERTSKRQSTSTFIRNEMNLEDQDFLFRDSVSRVIAAKSRPFSVSGRIPFDPSSLVLFFRSKNGTTHSLDFPIDVEHDTPPALSVLIAACTPISDDPLSSLFYPPNLPLTTSLEISNHPILDAVRATLFPFLPTGNYLTALRDKLDVIPSTRYMCTQPPSALLKDGRVATINIILPVRFRGGALVIRDTDASEERYLGRGGKSGDMEWSAYLPECEYEVEPVQKGCKLAISYGLYLRTFGPAGVHPEPLITPSDNFLDLFSPIFNTMRGRWIAFYLINDYGVDPSEVLAESLVSLLKGGDSLLYHAIKVYKLVPELRWTAGGYIWPIDRSVDWDNNEDRVPAVRGMFASTTDEHGVDNIRSKVELSGAIPLADAGIVVLTDWDAPRPAGKERAPFVSAGKLEKLVVNVLLVTYIP